MDNTQAHFFQHVCNEHKYVEVEVSTSGTGSDATSKKVFQCAYCGILKSESNAEEETKPVSEEVETQCLKRKNGGIECKVLCEGCFELYKIGTHEGKQAGVWVKSDPKIGDYYYCKVDTKQDCIVKTIVEWGKFKNGEYEYYDWDLQNVSHFGDFGEDAEVIEWLDETLHPLGQGEG